MDSTAILASQHETVVVFDFGSQYSHLITRRIREAGVYCELVSCATNLKSLPFKPAGIILSGSPYSVYEEGSPHADPEIWTCDVPVLGICYGLQEIAWSLGGKVSACPNREYGSAKISIVNDPELPPKARMLLNGIEQDSQVWMSHGDQLSQIPTDFKLLASTSTSPYTAIAHKTRQIYGVQFHPEVTHSVEGAKILRNFALDICGAKPTWSIKSFADAELERIRKTVGPEALVVGAVSGGVDSTVAAKLMHMAIGDRFHGILVDNGLMRLNEAKNVEQRLRCSLGINVTLVNASELFYERLHGVDNPEKKRKIIGHTFVDVFEREANRINSDPANDCRKVSFLLQGTLYPDVIESISYKGPSATIKTHHNVGGLKDRMPFAVIEPLRELFKDEVRALGTHLGLAREMVWRHPFPGPGLAIRVLGEVTLEKIKIVQLADEIYISEIRKAGLYDKISQAYAALLPFKSVGVMGDQRTYEQTICLRAVESTDFMTADWFDFPNEVLKKISSRIINEVRGVNRVMYDISSKPPSTIELE